VAARQHCSLPGWSRKFWDSFRVIRVFGGQSSFSRVNILFVNYGDFTTNSLNHIGGFANTLCAAGHACVVAVPQKKETLSHVATPLFIPATYDEALAHPALFPDGRPADLIHAWTPRECVRKFTLAYQRATGASARLIIHLEDNERFLLEAATGRSFAELRHASVDELDALLNDTLSHPIRYETFLGIADGVTHIIDRLTDLVPAGTPTHLLFPGVDFTLYHPQEPNGEYRAELGLRPEEKVIVFTGSNTFANEPEMRDLYLAVALLNQRGTPTRLVRTGFNSPTFIEGLAEDVRRHALDLGFVEKAKLPQLLALADVLVQPGRSGPFNDFRLPSKLPEFCAMGKPVALPPTNIARLMQDGREAIFLPTGAPGEIADTCARLFADPAAAAVLGENAAAFAHQHFDLAINTDALSAFYTATLQRAARADWTTCAKASGTDATLFAANFARSSDATAAAILADLVRELEQELARAALRAGESAPTPTATTRPSRVVDRLTQQHIRNLEDLLAAARKHAAALEQARDMTQAHAANLQREVERHQQRREQAEVLLRTARQQMTAYENALLGADAEIAALKANLAETQQTLTDLQAEMVTEAEGHAAELAAAARAEADLRNHHRAALADREAAAQRAEDALRAAHAAELSLAADRLAHAEAVIRSREEKIAKMQSSFSWQATTPFRAIRRALFDRPPPPSASPLLIGNIDYPHDWALIPPTLNVRGWSLHRDRKPLRAVRARLDRNTIPAEFGLERLDVLDHFRDYPLAERCGWIVKVDVPRFGRHQLVIEAQDEAGAWHVVHARHIKRTHEAPPPPPDSYAAWVAAYDTLTPESADRIREKLKQLRRRPLISVLMPTYDTPERWLVRAIESVRRQLYENWELCIADDASKAPHVRKILARYQQKDPRIKVVYRETNGHISAASNSALALVHGEFLALLDHDDELRPHALACVALELDAHPDADLVYSDEDKIDENGHRYDHYFKPDWNPDLFLVQNYISHLGVYRTLLVREVGGFRVGYEGSQDWDLAMRVVERTAPERIRHIPKILYHWRSVPGSTAMLIGAKSYATQAAEKVITEHLIRRGIEATISPTKGSYWRVHYPLPDPAPRVTLIIPTRNRLNVLRPCIESLREKTTYPNFEVLIVDNDSDDPETLSYLAQLETDDANASGRGQPDADASADAGTPATRIPVRVLRFPGEFNYSAINNFGVQHTDAPVIGLLNNDLEVIHGDWLEEMVSHALRPEIGCVGAKLYYPTDRIQHAGVILGIGGVAAHAWQTHPRGAAGQAHRNLLQQNLSAVTAACLVIRREVYVEVGGLDESLRVAFNDVDFCLKVRAAGYRNFWTPYAELYHHESASRGAEDTLEKRDRFRKEVEYVMAKWGDLLQHDPAYNPNLTLTINDFTLALPPRPWPPLDGDTLEAPVEAPEPEAVAAE
jgi:glycosyltransferase involved in cell wall biosynthesis